MEKLKTTTKEEVERWQNNIFKISKSGRNDRLLELIITHLNEKETGED